MNEWIIIGQIGVIKEIDNQTYLVNIAKNFYNSKTSQKESTIWFKCITKFKPTVQKGDKVIATGIFEPSSDENFPFTLKATHIAKIIKQEDVI